MILLPAIDLRGGRCVRLRRGDYAEETVYGDDPVLQALAFADAGASWVHMVDLDGALHGRSANLTLIQEAARELSGRGVRTQVGGGVRSVDDAMALQAFGVSRVVLGTAAVDDPDLVDAVAQVVDVALGLDVRGRDVAVKGWTESAGPLDEVLARYDGRPVDTYVVTQIGVDGTLAGPDLDLYRELLAAGVPLVASGGVGTLEHLRDLAALGVPAAIVGRALYEGAFTTEEALAACASPA